MPKLCPCNIGILCLGFILLFILVNRHIEGFTMSNDDKQLIAAKLVKNKPTYSSFRSNGLDGSHYYDAHQLWVNKRYTKDNLMNIIV